MPLSVRQFRKAGSGTMDARDSGMHEVPRDLIDVLFEFLRAICVSASATAYSDPIHIEILS